MPKTAHRKTPRPDPTPVQVPGKDDQIPIAALIAWYHRHHRKLPWRYPPGVRGDPYRIWLSEIMLQQTTVATVINYYEKFLKKWPTITRLAQAPEAEILKEWAGMGYYRRARHLHACSQVVVREHRGRFPETVKALAALPGIGPYTSAAIAAIAFGEGVVPVDGNIERVVARLYALPQPPATIKPKIRALAQGLYDQTTGIDAGDLAQALMDLGATICTPTSPQCGTCPLRSACLARKQNKTAIIPARAEKMLKPLRRGNIYLLQNKHGDFLLLRRPANGLFAGMLGFPVSGWDGADHALKIKDSQIIGQVLHSFTHFNLQADVVLGHYSASGIKDGFWYNEKDIQDAGVPKVFLKAWAVFHPRSEGGKRSRPA